MSKQAKGKANVSNEAIRISLPTEHRRLTLAGLENEYHDVEAAFMHARTKRQNAISMVDGQLKALTELRRGLVSLDAEK